MPPSRLSSPQRPVWCLFEIRSCCVVGGWPRNILLVVWVRSLPAGPAPRFPPAILASPAGCTLQGSSRRPLPGKSRTARDHQHPDAAADLRRPGPRARAKQAEASPVVATPRAPPATSTTSPATTSASGIGSQVTQQAGSRPASKPQVSLAKPLPSTAARRPLRPIRASPLFPPSPPPAHRPISATVNPLFPPAAAAILPPDPLARPADGRRRNYVPGKLFSPSS